MAAKSYWYTFVIVAVCLSVAIPFWKSRSRAKRGKLEPRHGTIPNVGIVQFSPVPGRVPSLLPGDDCEKADGTLGKPTEEDQFSRTWVKPDLVITATTDSACHLTGISIGPTPGHKALTGDGITLGATTWADAEKILEHSVSERSESVDTAEGHWSATLSLGAAPGMLFTTSYSAYIASDEAEAMNHDPLISDFRNRPIIEYNLEVVDHHREAK